MSYTTLGEYYLDKQVVSKPAKTQSPNVNHVWIYDRSGSMGWASRQVADDLIANLGYLQPGDTITLGWFSSKSLYGFPIKGYRFVGPDDVAILAKIINNNYLSLNMTCFSDVLVELEQITKDLAPINPNFALAFLTDGCPVPDTETERGRSFRAISSVVEKFATSVFVGYGDYYNRSLMAQMASGMGGTLVHISDIRNFGSFLHQTTDIARRSDGKIAVETEPGLLFFTINNGEIQSYDRNDGKVLVQPGTLYRLTEQKPDGEEAEELSASYTAALLCSQMTFADRALDILSSIGDIHLCNQLANAFTPSEYGKVEAEIKDAVFGVRFRAGKRKNCSPNDHALTLFAALEALQKDPQARFYPASQAFDYKRIGAGTVTEPGYPKFRPNQLCPCRFDDLVWNEKRLNLSLLAKIDGRITLNGEVAGLDKEFDTYVWRTYTIIRDGMLNVTRLPATISHDTFDLMRDFGIISPNIAWEDGAMYVLQLDAVPIISRANAKHPVSAKALCEMIWAEKILEAKQKVYKFYLKALKPEDEPLAGYTPEQSELLVASGVTKNGFNPPTQKAEHTDFYEAFQFNISVKGFSSWPKVEEADERLNNGKNLTPAMQLMVDSINFCNGMIATTGKPNAAKQLTTLLADNKRALSFVRNDVARVKLVMVLAKKWFEEFDNRGPQTIEVDSHQFNIEVKEKVRIDI